MNVRLVLFKAITVSRCHKNFIPCESVTAKFLELVIIENKIIRLFSKQKLKFFEQAEPTIFVAEPTIFVSQ